MEDFNQGCHRRDCNYSTFDTAMDTYENHHFNYLINKGYLLDDMVRYSDDVEIREIYAEIDWIYEFNCGGDYGKLNSCINGAIFSNVSSDNENLFRLLRKAYGIIKGSLVKNIVNQLITDSSSAIRDVEEK